MRKYYQFIQRLYEKKVDGVGLAIFRIVYSAVLLCEVLQIFYFRHLIFDEVPFLKPSEVDFGPALVAWMAAIVLLMLGAFTRQAAIINYLFSLVFIATISTFEYHMFYLYMGMNFLLIFLNISQVNSVDCLRVKLRYLSVNSNYEPNRKISILNYYLPLLIGIAFVYFDSIFFKLDSNLWRDGLGLWLPASVPQMVQLNASVLLNVKPLVIFLGYFSLIFEMVFLFVFGFRRFWKVLFVVGVAFHIGILLIFPIPWFALGVISFYLLLVPASVWQRISERMKYKSGRIKFFYDEECLLCVRTKIILKHFDFLNVVRFVGVQSILNGDEEIFGRSKEKLQTTIYGETRSGRILEGINVYRYIFLRMPALSLIGLLLYVPGIFHIGRRIYRLIAHGRSTHRCGEDSHCRHRLPVLLYGSNTITIWRGLDIGTLKVFLISIGIVLLFFLQAASTYRSPLIRNWVDQVGLSESRSIKLLDKLTWRSQRFSKTYLGITGHSVFVDSHFDDYNHIVALEYRSVSRDIWLPIIKKDGRPGSYLLGPTWAKWSFRVNSPEIDSVKLREGIRNFSAFWLGKEGYPVNGARFIVWVKKIDMPNGWSYDFLKKQQEKPWVRAGNVVWDEENITIEIGDIEKI